MPTITITKHALKQRIGKDISDDELKNTIVAIGGSVEEDLGEELKVEINPNRPDFLSEQGLGRALSSFLEVSKGLATYDIQKSGLSLTVKESVQSVRPFTACAIVKGLHFDDAKIKEIIQIQEKLHITYGRNRKKCAIGVYPLEKIQFPVSFVGKNPSEVSFVPLESPGLKAMTGLQVLSQHPTGRDYGFLLEGKETFPFFVDAKEDILSMPPIINSHTVGKISEETTDVFIECSGFDQHVLDICLNMVVTALADMGGSIYSVTLENEHAGWTKESPSLQPTELLLPIPYVEKYLGITLSSSEIVSLLEKMGFGILEQTQEYITALVPAYRSDVLHPIDLVEDIAIAYGFDNFKPIIPDVATIAKRDVTDSYKSRIANILAGLGLFETNTFCLVGEKDNAATSTSNIVRLANSVAEGYDSMRNNVTVSLLKVLQNNRNRDYPQGFFEIGYVFSQDASKETKVNEKFQLAMVFADAKANFTYARQVCMYLSTQLHIPFTIKTPTLPVIKYLEGRFAEIYAGDTLIGHIGEINPHVLDYFSLETPVCSMQLDFDALVKMLEKQ